MNTFDNSELERYEAEAQVRWGKTDAYREYAEKTKRCAKDKRSSADAGLDAIFAEFARCMKNGAAAGAQEPQALVTKLRNHITENYYTCTGEILFGLGQMYVADERFKNNIDRHAEGTAAFVSEAIAVFSGKQ